MHFLVLQVYGPRLVGLRFSRFSSPDYFLPCLISFAEHSGSNPVLARFSAPSKEVSVAERHWVLFV